MKTKSSRKRKSARRAEPTREQVAALIRRAEWWCRLVERRLRARRLALGWSHKWVAVWAALSRQDPPTQADLLAVIAKLNELLNALRR